jgi:hypothetical protein
MGETVHIKTPVDLVNYLPVIFGFVPEESVAMVCLKGDTPFHARIDLPPADDVAAQSEVIVSLSAAAAKNGAHQVAFVILGHDRRAAEQMIDQLSFFHFAVASIAVALWADGHHVRNLGAMDEQPIPYTPASLQGQDVAPTRGALAAELVRNEEAVEQVESLIEGWSCTDDAATARWLVTRLTDDEPFTVEETARALAGIANVHVRDVAWTMVNRTSAAQLRKVFVRWVKSAPAHLVAPAAALVAFAAWQDGDGARAWVAVDEALAWDAEYALAQMTGTLLDQAVPPEKWEPVSLSELPILSN